MVEILLATYNGERYLAPQIESLLNQDYPDWRLLVRDDGSSDRTLEILEACAGRSDGRFTVLANGGTRLGPGGNFSELLRQSKADYSMFCDQDDVWLPEKIGLTLAKMKELEAACGPETPLLVHTDLRIVDAGLEPVADSGHRYQKIDPPQRTGLGRLLVQNVATGCTVMVNRALRDRALPVPGAALMHDHWLSLVAGSFGRIGYVPQATMLYRQHGGNQVGAKGWSARYALRLVGQLSFLRQVMERNRSQARAFYQQYHASLSEGQRAMLAAFIQMPERGPLGRRLDIIRHGFFYAGAIRNLGWLLLC